VAGVEKVEAHNGRGALLYLQPGVTPNNLLASLAAAPGVSVEKFALAVPRLNDIFIRVVEHRDTGNA
jgi:hypothetical protein